MCGYRIRPYYEGSISMMCGCPSGQYEDGNDCIDDEDTCPIVQRYIAMQAKNELLFKHNKRNIDNPIKDLYGD